MLSESEVLHLPVFSKPRLSGESSDGRGAGQVAAGRMAGQSAKPAPIVGSVAIVAPVRFSPAPFTALGVRLHADADVAHSDVANLPMRLS